MKRAFSTPLSIVAVLVASLVVAACTTAEPNVIPGSSPSLAPGASGTAAPTLSSFALSSFTPAPFITPGPVITPAPGTTLPPITPAPPVTAPPVVTNPPPPPTPTAEATPTNAHPDWPPGALQPNQAADHIGENATVCGKVNAANWIFIEKGHPTWLNLGPAYPNLRFTAVIWGEERRAWPLNGKPEVRYLNRVICVTGMIEGYQGWTQIQNLTMGDIQVIP